MAMARLVTSSPTACWMPPTFTAPVRSRVATAVATYPGGNTAWASHRTTTSPDEAEMAALRAAGVTRAGLSTMRTLGSAAASSSITSRVPSLLIPSATTTSMAPS